MQAYIGTKIILAEECCKENFEEHKKKDFPVDFDFEVKAEGDGSSTSTPGTLGYHVVYPNPDGSKYHSWSPKDVFERAYRRVYTDEKQLTATY